MLQCKSSTEKEVFALTKQIFSFMTVLALAVSCCCPVQVRRIQEQPLTNISGLPCEASVNKLYEAGVVAGLPPTPSTGGSATRAQMATILVRAYGQEEQVKGKLFADAGEPLGLLFTSASALGLIYGVSDTPL